MIESVVEGLSVAIAGFVSFGSPCVLPLVLPFAAYIAAATLGGKPSAAVSAPRSQSAALGLGLMLGLCFAVGFAAVFVARGAGATAIGDTLQGAAPQLTWIAGALLMLAGLHYLRVLIVPVFPAQGRLVGLGAVLVGAAFVFGWTPCAGPVLSAALTLASMPSTAVAGIGYLTTYAAGLGLAFAVLAGAIAWALSFAPVANVGAERVLGGTLIASGIALVTGFLQTVGFWLLVTVPTLGRLESLATPDSLPAMMMQRGSGL